MENTEKSNKNLIYLMKYKVNYTEELKYKAFRTFEDATYFHQNYNHHLAPINFMERPMNCPEPFFITHFEIIVLDLDFLQIVDERK